MRCDATVDTTNLSLLSLGYPFSALESLSRRNSREDNGDRHLVTSGGSAAAAENLHENLPLCVMELLRTLADATLHRDEKKREKEGKRERERGRKGGRERPRDRLMPG